MRENLSLLRFLIRKENEFSRQAVWESTIEGEPYILWLGKGRGPEKDPDLRYREPGPDKEVNAGNPTLYSDSNSLKVDLLVLQ